MAVFLSLIFPLIFSSTHFSLLINYAGAISSVVERCPDKTEVKGAIPLSPTIKRPTNAVLMKISAEIFRSRIAKDRGQRCDPFIAYLGRKVFLKIFRRLEQKIPITGNFCFVDCSTLFNGYQSRYQNRGNEAKQSGHGK